MTPATCPRSDEPPLANSDSAISSDAYDFSADGSGRPPHGLARGGARLAVDLAPELEDELLLDEGVVVALEQLRWRGIGGEGVGEMGLGEVAARAA